MQKEGRERERLSEGRVPLFLFPERCHLCFSPIDVLGTPSPSFSRVCQCHWRTAFAQIHMLVLCVYYCWQYLTRDKGDADADADDSEKDVEATDNPVGKGAGVGLPCLL